MKIISIAGFVPMLFFLVGTSALAEELTVPHTFVDGDIAYADQVNDNFKTLSDKFNGTQLIGDLPCSTDEIAQFVGTAWQCTDPYGAVGVAVISQSQLSITIQTNHKKPKYVKLRIYQKDSEYRQNLLGGYAPFLYSEWYDYDRNGEGTSVYFNSNNYGYLKKSTTEIGMFAFPYGNSMKHVEFTIQTSDDSIVISKKSHANHNAWDSTPAEPDIIMFWHVY